MAQAVRHARDFTNRSATGMNACVYQVRIIGSGSQAMVWIEAPPLDRKAAASNFAVEWELVEMKGVSEGMYTIDRARSN